MSARGRTERILRLGLWVSALLLAVGFSVAEVGVTVRNVTGDLQVNGPIVVGIIVDEHDPVGLWGRQSALSAPRQLLNEQGGANGDGKPTLLYNTVSRLPIVAWSRNSPSGFDLVVSRFQAGVWTTPEVVSGLAADELDPFLLQDPTDGSVHLFYWIHDANPRVLHRVAPADLSSWSAPTVISAPGEIASRPSALFANGMLEVVYESHGGGFGAFPRHIVHASGTIGSGFSYFVLTNTYEGLPNWPRPHRTGQQFWVEWIDSEGVMTWTQKDPVSGAGGPFEAEPFAGFEEEEYHVRGKVRHRVLEGE